MSSFADASSSARRTSNRAVSSADLVLRGLGRGVRLHLRDLLLRLGQLRLRLLERELLIRRIELDDDLAGLHRHAGLHQLDDAQHAADRRRHERHGPSGAQLAGRVDRQLQRPFRELRGRHRAAALRQARHGSRSRRRRSADGAEDQQLQSSPGVSFLPPDHLRGRLARRDAVAGRDARCDDRLLLAAARTWTGCSANSQPSSL